METSAKVNDNVELAFSTVSQAAVRAEQAACEEEVCVDPEDVQVSRRSNRRRIKSLNLPRKMSKAVSFDRKVQTLEIPKKQKKRRRLRCTIL